MSGHNKPPAVILELDVEMAEFLVENCDANLNMGLLALKMVQSRDLLERLVANIEKFKKLKALTKKAMK